MVAHQLAEAQNFIGVSAAIARLRRDIEDAARCDAKVLITGESGVGKEVAANLIHAGSARRSQRLVVVNCAAMAETLLETELFGHVKGSFTGAYRDRMGVLEIAHHGTVLLDEVGEMTPRMQGMLLRFLESGEVHRVGSDQPQRRVDVRVIAATNRVLADEIASGTFRGDLYYRLNIIPMFIPPLRERREDIPALLDQFIGTCSREYRVPPVRLSPTAQALLCEYEWPGNVRELKNVVERLVTRGQSRPIEAAELPEEIRRRAGAKPAHDHGPAAARREADVLFERVVHQGEDFWLVVHTPFMQRDLTRADLRALVARGLTETSGSYRQLVTLFNLPPSDYKRLLGFLRKYDCQMPLRQFRSAHMSVA